MWWLEDLWRGSRGRLGKYSPRRRTWASWREIVAECVMSPKFFPSSLHGPLGLCSSSSQRWSLQLLKTRLVLRLALPVECGRSDVVQSPEPRPQEASQLLPLCMWSPSLGPLCQEEAQMKDHMAREASSLAVPTRSSSQLTYHEWAQKNHPVHPQNHKKEYIHIVLSH